MTSETYNPADEPRRIIAEGCVSEAALQAITGMQLEKLRTFFSEAKPGMTGLSAGPPHPAQHRPVEGTRRRRPRERPARPTDRCVREEVRTRDQGFLPHQRRQSSTRSVSTDDKSLTRRCVSIGAAKSRELLCGTGTSTTGGSLSSVSVGVFALSF